MRIRFYLKRPDSKTDTSIFALINYGGNQLKIYTGESILPKNWNPESQTARNTPRFPEHPEFNERLNSIRSAINRAYLDYRNTHGGEAPTPSEFRALAELILKKGGVRTSFLEYFQDFINRTTNGQRINPKSRKPVRETSVRGYQTTLNHLKEFSKSWSRNLDFDTVDIDFHSDFTKYLVSPPNLLSANTVGSHIQRIKAVMAEATEKGVNKNTAFKSRFFVKQTEEADTIYLSVQELQELEKLDLSGSARLDNVRDLFLIGCYTGLRFSDFTTITSENIKEGIIRITQAKTNSPVSIPVHRVVKRIIEKHGGSIPKGISNEKMNAYLKEVCQKLDCLNRPEKKAITKGGATVVKSVEKWGLVTTHTARRSFATNEYLAGTPSITIMAITGHKTEKSFLKYIRVNQEEHAVNMANLWQAREKRSKLKAV